MVKSLEVELQRNTYEEARLRQRVEELEQSLARTQRELASSRARETMYQETLDHIPDYLVRFDRELRHVYMNASLFASGFFEEPYAQYLGCTHQEIPLYADWWIEFWTKHIRQVFETGEPLRVDVRADNPDEPSIYDWRLIPEFGPDGNVQSVLTISTDVGERIRTADRMSALNSELTRGIEARTRELAEAHQALQKESALLASSIELLPFPMFFVTADNTIYQANRAAIAFFGEIAVQHWHDIVVTATSHPHEAPCLDEWLLVRVLNGIVIHGEEGTIRLPDGREVPVLAHGAPVYVGETLVAATVAFQDVSALKAADRAKDQFLAMLSHELRNPLTSVMAWSEMARESPDPVTVSRALEIVTRNARQLRHLVNDLLDVSSIVYHKMTITLGMFDLWTLGVQAVESCQHAMQAKGLCLTLTPPVVSLPVMVDPQRLSQVINNLLANAVRYTEAGGTIAVAATIRGGYAVLAVTDSGCGMTPETITKLFRPFQRHSAHRTPGGLGLGLALVKGIVELHGGRVYAASPGPGQGSTFTIELPIHA